MNSPIVSWYPIQIQHNNMQEFLAMIDWHLLVRKAQAICDGEPIQAGQKVDGWLLQKVGLSPKVRETIVRELCKVIGSGKKPVREDFMGPQHVRPKLRQ